MITYIILLRGINVGGQKKIRMAELRKMLEKLDFHDVLTYIQSGNIVVKTAEKNIQILEDNIRKSIFDTFGFDVPVLVKPKDDLKDIFKQNPFTEVGGHDNERVYFVLLKQMPELHLIQAMQEETYPNEKFFVTKNCVYLSCLKGYGNAKLNNNLLERKLKVSATTRNYKTMLKLIQLSKLNKEF